MLFGIHTTHLHCGVSICTKWEFSQCPLQTILCMALSDLADVYLVAAGAADGDAHLAVPGDVLAHVDLSHHRVGYLEGHRGVDRVLESACHRLRE